MAVLVVPFFIDWSDHRETFEREASALIGHKVTVKGEADAKFLPIPTFSFTDIEVGKKGEQPLMSAGRLKVQVELIALLSGKINVIDMELDAPQASLRIGTDGKTNWALNKAAATRDDRFQVKLGPVAIRGGAIYFVDQKTLRSFSIDEIDATVTAQSLIGPWKFEGQAKQNNDPFDFKLATGKFADNKIRVKTTLLPKNLGLDGIFDGEVLLPQEGQQATGPTYKGNMLVRPRRKARNVGEPTPKTASRFELAGLFELDSSKFLLSQAVFEDGAREAPLSLNGSLRVPLDGDVGFQAVVSSRQIDLDRAYGKGLEEPISVQDASSVVTNIIRGLPKPPIPGTISFDVPGVVVGGDVVRSVHFDATPNDKGWQIDDFGAVLPGTTRIGFEGLLETGEAFLLDGDLQISSDRPISLARWWRPNNGDDVRRLRVRDFRLTSKISAEENAVRLSGLKAAIGTSDLGGRVAFTKVSERQNRFDANLTANRLDLDAIQALTALFVGEGNVSGFRSQDVVAVKMQANTMIMQAVEGRDALIDLKISDNEIDIGSLKIADFSGAEIDISGSVKDVLTNPSGKLLGSIKAEDTKGLVKLGDALFPDHQMLSHLKRYGSAFVPLDVQVNFSGDQKQDRNTSDFAATVTGSLGSGDMRAGLRFVGDWQKADEGDVELSFFSAYNDGTALLKQLGWPVFDVGTSGPAEIDITARGKGTTGIALKTDLLLEEVRTKSDGVVFLQEAKPPRYEMDASLEGQNVEPMLQMLGFTLPASGLGSSGSFSTKLSGTGLKGELKGLAGSVEGQEFSGELSFVGQPLNSDKPWRWNGDLNVERLSLNWLSSLGTGEIITPVDLTISPDGVGEAHLAADDPNEKNEGAPLNWSQAQFNEPYLEKVSADIKLTGQAFQVSDSIELNNPSVTMRLRENSLALTDLEAQFGGGDVSGSIRFENAGGAVTMSGLMELAKVSATDLFWDDDQRPLVEGDVSGSFQFEGTGRSVDAVVNTLGGGGSLALSDGRIRRINPSAFGLILDAADKDDLILDDETVRPLIKNHLDAGVLDVKKAEASFTMTSGVLRVANTSLNNADVRSNISASFDLPELTMKGSMALSVDPANVDKTPVSGSTPEIGVLFEGALENPVRSFDLQPLLSYLTVRRFEQEVQRVEILQADILEKQRLSRYARWVSYEVEREQRLLEEERLRLEEEQERLRLEAIEKEEARAREAREKARRRAQAAAERAAERERLANQPINIDEELRRLEEEAATNIPPANAPLELRPNISN